MTPFAVAGMQLHLSAFGDNLPHIRARLHHLMHVFPWVEMVVFSELAALGPIPARAQPMPGPAEHAFCEMAAHHQIWIVTGSIFESSGGKIYNTSSVIDPTGSVIGRYRKMFPFRPYEIEVEPGDSFLVFDVPDVGRFGVSICYDMWFPETSRSLVALGAEVIIHPSMTTTIDRDVELAMARATAAQNQCYVVDINGAGEGGNGRSIVVGPAGDVIHLSGTTEELIPLEIELGRVRREREHGLYGLGQPLKSFRDSAVTFPVYANDGSGKEILNRLGPLEKPRRKRGAAPGRARAPAGGKVQGGD